MLPPQFFVNPAQPPSFPPQVHQVLQGPGLQPYWNYTGVAYGQLNTIHVSPSPFPLSRLLALRRQATYFESKQQEWETPDIAAFSTSRKTVGQATVQNNFFNFLLEPVGRSSPVRLMGCLCRLEREVGSG